jgi:hypothetical protein
LCLARRRCGLALDRPFREKAAIMLYRICLAAPAASAAVLYFLKAKSCDLGAQTAAAGCGPRQLFAASGGRAGTQGRGARCCRQVQRTPPSPAPAPTLAAPGPCPCRVSPSWSRWSRSSQRPPRRPQVSGSACAAACHAQPRAAPWRPGALARARPPRAPQGMAPGQVWPINACTPTRPCQPPC